ncbi:hypothetical protein 8014-B2_00108 [Lactobacillus phage ATCC 8014-B2]|uniref:DUF1642 domain-containing protein n=1 Tax=Lactobacillus phage ATCC 8014-B2 TaxID=1225795 RepID=K4I4G7_9CAUD|nr:hypothetical protein HOQ89_gp038 [Lactobacillus phage ATCC 8014-B2]AFU63175.1 hypothetical protein 8014-B2_00108 [Lactobacillus phage ATCC 8014-B2]
MVKKYNIVVEDGDYTKDYSLTNDGVGHVFYQRYFISTLEGPLELRVGSYIATGIKDEHWAIADDVFKKTYAELPVIPKNVANYLTDCKRANTTIGTSLSGNIVLFSHARSHDMIHDILSWLCPSDNQDLFARAWLDGYVVEEDQGNV